MFNHVEGDFRHFGKKEDNTWGPFSLDPEGKLKVLVEQATGATVSGTHLSALAVENSTAYAVTVAWEDIDFDTSLINTDPSLIYQDAVNTERFYVDKDSLYSITYGCSVRTSGASRDTQARIFKNNNTVVPSSFSNILTYQDEVHNLCRNTLVYLTQGDYITFQIVGLTVPTDVLAGYYLHIVDYSAIKGADGNNGLPGAPGAPGLPGAGTTINVSDDYVLTASGISNLNFGENINVVDDGNGTATVGVDLSLLTEAHIDIYDLVGGTNVTSTWTDIPFDSQRQMTSAFSHIVATTGITSNIQGEHVVVARSTLGISSGTDRTLTEIRLSIDTGSGFVVVPGSTARMYNRTLDEGSDTATITCLPTFGIGDVIKLQARIVSGSSVIATVPEGTSITIFSTQGQKGDAGVDGLPGTPGAGSTLLIQDEGSYLPNTPHSILNFIGAPVTLTDGGGGVANITVSAEALFGSSFHTVSSDAASSTTSSTYQQKLRLTTGLLVPLAVYRVGWFYEWNFRSSSNDIMVQGQIDDAVNMFTQREEPQDSGSDQYHTDSGFYYHTASSINAINIDIDFASSNGSQASLRNTRLEFWRVS